MNGDSNHYGFCCAGRHCAQSDRVVYFLFICSICGNAMHDACGVTTGDSSLICYPCLRDDVPGIPDNFFHGDLGDESALEFIIEESSCGTNYKPASFPSASCVKDVVDSPILAEEPAPFSEKLALECNTEDDSKLPHFCQQLFSPAELCAEPSDCNVAKAAIESSSLPAVARDSIVSIAHLHYPPLLGILTWRKWPLSRLH